MDGNDISHRHFLFVSGVYYRGDMDASRVDSSWFYLIRVEPSWAKQTCSQTIYTVSVSAESWKSFFSVKLPSKSAALSWRRVLIASAIGQWMSEWVKRVKRERELSPCSQLQVQEFEAASQKFYSSTNSRLILFSGGCFHKVCCSATTRNKRTGDKLRHTLYTVSIEHCVSITRTLSEAQHQNGHRVSPFELGISFEAGTRCRQLFLLCIHKQTHIREQRSATDMAIWPCLMLVSAQ